MSGGKQPSGDAETVTVGEDVSWDSEGQRALEQLVKAAPGDGVALAIEVLSDCGSGTKMHAGATVREILRVLAERNVREAVSAIRSLVESRGSSVTQPEAVHRSAIQALFAIDHHAALDTVEPLLSDFSAQSRRAVAASAGSAAGPEPCRILVRLGSDPDVEVRARATGGLGSKCCDSSESLNLAVSLLRDPAGAVRSKAVWWCGECLLQRLEPEVVRALKDADAQVRAAALEALAKLGSKGGCDSVQSLMTDPSALVRARAAKYLSEVKCR